MSQSPRMSKSLNSVLAGVVLLLMQVGSSAADTPPTDQGPAGRNHDSAAGRAPVGDGYASVVPAEGIINQNQSTLAADKGEQSIPVAEEIDFVTGNSFRKVFEESL